MELCHQSSAMCVPTQAIIPVDEQQQKNQQTFHTCHYPRRPVETSF